MPFERESDAGTREAATARVLQRRATHPSDRHVLRVVAEEFGVREQTLREWVAEASPWPDEVPAKKKRRPKFSPVVTRRIEPTEEPESEAGAQERPLAPSRASRPAAVFDEAGVGVASAAFEGRTAVAEPVEREAEVEPAAAPAEPAAPAELAPAPTAAAAAPTAAAAAPAAPAAAPSTAALEAEIAELRRENAILKDALRVVLGG